MLSNSLNIQQNNNRNLNFAFFCQNPCGFIDCIVSENDNNIFRHTFSINSKENIIETEYSNKFNYFDPTDVWSLDGKIEFRDYPGLFFSFDNNKEKEKFKIFRLQPPEYNKVVKEENVDAIMQDFENKKLYVIKNGKKYQITNLEDQKFKLLECSELGFKSAICKTEQEINKNKNDNNNSNFEIIDVDKIEDPNDADSMKSEVIIKENKTNKTEKMQYIPILDGSVLSISYCDKKKKIKIEKYYNIDTAKPEIKTFYCDAIDDFNNVKFLKFKKDNQEFFLNLENFYIYEIAHNEKDKKYDISEIYYNKKKIKLKITNESYEELIQKEQELEEKKRQIRRNKYYTAFYERDDDAGYRIKIFCSNKNKKELEVKTKYISNDISSDKDKNKVYYNYDESEKEYCFHLFNPNIIAKKEPWYKTGRNMVLKNKITGKTIDADLVEDNIEHDLIYITKKGVRYSLKPDTFEKIKCPTNYIINEKNDICIIENDKETTILSGEQLDNNGFMLPIYSKCHIFFVLYDKKTKQFTMLTDDPFGHISSNKNALYRQNIKFEGFEIINAKENLIKITQQGKQYLLDFNYEKFWRYEKVNAFNVSNRKFPSAAYEQKITDYVLCNEDQQKWEQILEEEKRFKEEKERQRNKQLKQKGVNEIIKKLNIIKEEDVEDDNDNNNKVNKDIDNQKNKTFDKINNKVSIDNKDLLNKNSISDNFCLFFNNKKVKNGIGLVSNYCKKMEDVKEINDFNLKPIKNNKLHIIKGKYSIKADMLLIHNNEYYIYDNFYKYKLDSDNFKIKKINSETYSCSQQDQNIICYNDTEGQTLKKTINNPIKTFITTEGKKVFINSNIKNKKQYFTIHYFDEQNKERSIDVDEFEDFGNTEFLKIKIGEKTYFFNLLTGYRFEQKTKQINGIPNIKDFSKRGVKKIDADFFLNAFEKKTNIVDLVLGNHFEFNDEILLELDYKNQPVQIALINEDHKKLDDKREKINNKQKEEKEKKEEKKKKNIFDDLYKKRIDYIEAILKTDDRNNNKEYQFNIKDLLKHMFSDPKIKKSYKKIIHYYVYEHLAKDDTGMLDFIKNSGKVKNFFQEFMESFRNKKIPGKEISYFEYVKQEILSGCNNETQKKLKQIMSEKTFQKAFDMIFSNLLIVPLFKGETTYYDFDPVDCLLRDPWFGIDGGDGYKNNDLIKLSNASILITKFLVKNDKKNEENNDIYNFFKKKDKDRVFRIRSFLNNIDGNFYRLLKLLDDAGVIEDIDFEIFEENIDFGGHGLIFENTGKTYYIKPKIILKEQSLKDVVFTLHGDIVSKKPTSRHCLDVLEELKDRCTFYVVANNAIGYDNKELFDTSQLIEAKNKGSFDDCFKKRQEIFASFRDYKKYPYHLPNLMYRQFLFFNDNKVKLKRNIRSINFFAEKGTKKDWTDNINVKEKFGHIEMDFKNNPIQQKSDIIKKYEYIINKNNRICTENNLKIARQATFKFDSIFNTFVNGYNNSINAIERPGDLNSFESVNKNSIESQDLPIGGYDRIDIGGFRHNFGKYNFLDNYNDSNILALSSSTREMFTFVEKKTRNMDNNEIFKIITLDKNPLENNKNKRHLELDISNKKNNKPKFFEKDNYVNIDKNIKESFCEVLNEFIKNNNFLIDFNTFIRKEKVNDNNLAKHFFNEHSIMYNRSDVFLRRVQYDKEKDKCTLLFEYFDENKRKQIFNVTSQLLVPQTSFVSSENFFDECVEGLINLIKGISIEGEKEWTELKEEKKIGQFNKRTNYIMDIQIETINSIFEEKETLSTFKEFYFNLFKNKLEKKQQGPIGIDKERQKKIEEIKTDENKKDELQIVEQIQAENKKKQNLNNVDVKVKKIKKEQKDKYIKERIKDGKFSIVGDKNEHLKKVINIFELKQIIQENKKINQEARMEVIKDCKDEQVKKQLETIQEVEEQQEFEQNNIKQHKQTIKLDIKGINTKEMQDIKQNYNFYRENRLMIDINRKCNYNPKDLRDYINKMEFDAIRIMRLENDTFFLTECSEFKEKLEEFTRFLNSNINGIMIMAEGLTADDIHKKIQDYVYDFEKNIKSKGFANKYNKFFNNDQASERSKVLKMELNKILLSVVEEYYENYDRWLRELELEEEALRYEMFMREKLSPIYFPTNDIKDKYNQTIEKKYNKKANNKLQRNKPIEASQ